MTKQFAIIENAHVAKGSSTPIVRFSTRIGSGEAAFQLYTWEEIGALIQNGIISTPADLNGKVCLVRVEGAMIVYLGLLEEE